MTEIDLSSIVWRAPEWINMLGGLRSDNGNNKQYVYNIVHILVLEYFSQSPFFDRRSNNAALKMQSQFQSFGDLSDALRRMRGVEFVIQSEAPPDLWIIKKQQREGYDDVRPISIYFVANGNIYLAPDVHSIISSRILNITQTLNAAVNTLNDAVQFDVASGYRYGAEAMQKATETKPSEEESDIVMKDQAEDSMSVAVESKSAASLSNIEIQSMHKALFSAMNARR